jgi:hypothetical protein
MALEKGQPRNLLLLGGDASVILIPFNLKPSAYRLTFTEYTR